MERWEDYDRTVNACRQPVIVFPSAPSGPTNLSETITQVWSAPSLCTSQTRTTPFSPSDLQHPLSQVTASSSSDAGLLLLTSIHSLFTPPAPSNPISGHPSRSTFRHPALDFADRIPSTKYHFRCPVLLPTDEPPRPQCTRPRLTQLQIYTMLTAPHPYKAAPVLEPNLPPLSTSWSVPAPLFAAFPCAIS